MSAGFSLLACFVTRQRAPLLIIDLDPSVSKSGVCFKHSRCFSNRTQPLVWPLSRLTQLRSRRCKQSVHNGPALHRCFTCPKPKLEKLQIGRNLE